MMDYLTAKSLYALEEVFVHQFAHPVRNYAHLGSFDRHVLSAGRIWYSCNPSSRGYMARHAKV